jgi:hypothetical protein
MSKKTKPGGYSGAYSKVTPIPDKRRNSRADGRTTPPHNPSLAARLERNAGPAGSIKK